jgi:hypothetical protein
MSIVKYFKSFLNESADKSYFNTFVNNVISTHKVDMNKAAALITNDQYTYRGLIYRVQWCPVAEILNLQDADNVPDRKAIADYLAQKIAINAYILYCKSLDGVNNQIKYPGVVKNLTEDKIGVVYSVDTKAAIDFTKYEPRDEISKRLTKTQEVLSMSFAEMMIKNIDALYYMSADKTGWTFETDLSKPLNVKSAEPAEEPVAEEPVTDDAAPSEEGVTK